MSELTYGRGRKVLPIKGSMKRPAEDTGETGSNDDGVPEKEKSFVQDLRRAALRATVQDQLRSQRAEATQAAQAPKKATSTGRPITSERDDEDEEKKPDDDYGF